MYTFFLFNKTLYFYEQTALHYPKELRYYLWTISAIDVNLISRQIKNVATKAFFEGDSIMNRLALIALTLGMSFCALGADIPDSWMRLDVQEKQTKFVPIYIQKIKNLTSTPVSLESLPAASEKTTRIASKILIPFISIASYLREYAEKKAYTPQEALTIITASGRYRLWASESGVMCARDSRDEAASLDNVWDAEKILGTTARELGPKKEYIATLVLKAAAQTNKTTIFLEPAHS